MIKFIKWVCVENIEKGLMLKLIYEGWILVRRKLGGVGSCLEKSNCMNKSIDKWEYMTCYN